MYAIPEDQNPQNKPPPASPTVFLLGKKHEEHKGLRMSMKQDYEEVKN